MGLKSKQVTCRYGVTYMAMFKGSAGEISRGFDLMSRCCCWVCTNLECENPRNEKIDGCGQICGLYTKTPYCQDDIMTGIENESNQVFNK